MNENNLALSSVTFRIYVSTHTILKALAADEDVSMVELVDRLIREEAQRKGFTIRELRQTPPKGESREITIVG